MKNYLHDSVSFLSCITPDCYEQFIKISNNILHCTQFQDCPTHLNVTFLKPQYILLFRSQNSCKKGENSSFCFLKWHILCKTREKRLYTLWSVRIGWIKEGLILNKMQNKYNEGNKTRKLSLWTIQRKKLPFVKSLLACRETPPEACLGA
jgi:hypothetical protein